MVVGWVFLAAGCASASPSAGVAAQPTEGLATLAPAVSATLAPTVQPPAGGQPTSAAAGAKTVTFNLTPGTSEARFLIDEVLAGSPNKVVGTTADVTGQIQGDFAKPASVVVGPIKVDMSSLKTDNNFRNRALQGAILQTGTDVNRYAVFQVKQIEGLPQQVSFGTAYPLSLVGDLTIHGVTRPVTFDAKVTPVSETRLEGTASASMPYSDFGISILRLPPQVASVADAVTLEIDFVAEAE
jgi:polyisoprenoid-binding protein YceI